MPLKTCSRCKETKDINQFTKDKSKPDGLRNSCKSMEQNGILIISFPCVNLI